MSSQFADLLFAARSGHRLDASQCLKLAEHQDLGALRTLMQVAAELRDAEFSQCSHLLEEGLYPAHASVP